MPINVEVSYSSPPKNWDNTVCDLGGNIFHSHIWAVLQSRLRKISPLYISIKNNTGEIIGGLLAFLCQSDYPLLNRISKVLEVTSHPFGRDMSIETVNAFLEEIEKLAKKLNCATIQLNSNMSGHSLFIPKDHGYTESRRVEFHVDLSKSEDELWSGMAKDQKARVRQIEKKGTIIEECQGRSDFNYLHSVRITTKERRASSGMGYDLTEDQKYYDILYESLSAKGSGRLFFAKYESDVLAAIYFSTFNRQAYSVFSGSSKIGYKMGAQTGLYWQAVKTFKAEGFSLLNRGGVDASTEDKSHKMHGLYRFKKRLGTVPVLCRSGEKISSPMRYNLLNLKRHIFR